MRSALVESGARARPRKLGPMRRAPRTLLVTASAALVLPVPAALATSVAERHQWLDIVPSVRVAAPAAEMRIILFRGAPAAARRGATGGSTAAAAATRRQDHELAALRAGGIHVDVQGRFVRVVDAVVARVRPADLARLERRDSIRGVFPVRALTPTALSDSALTALGAGARPLPVSAGADGARTTVAVLDGPIDPTPPYLGGRVSVAAGLQSGKGLSAGAEHGTALAGIVTGAGGPGGLSGVAPASSVLAIPIFSVAPDGALAGTDADLLAGLERAADPNGDGDLADRARVALVAATAPFASFASTPVDEATDGLARLGTVVVAAAGNDGPTGSPRGSIGAPASGPSVLAVGATDGRVAVPSTTVTFRGGSAELGGTLGLLDTVAPPPGLTLPIRLPGADAAGAAVLVQRGASLRSQARAAAASGASAVIVWGDDPGPSGALGIDDAAPLPVLALDAATAATLARDLTGGAPLTVAFGATALSPNPGLGTVAAFSASGLTDDGRLKPDVVAPGVAIVSSTGGGFASLSGTSVSAAQVAGLAAGLAGRHPDWSADRLRAALVGTAAPVTDAAGALADVATQGGGSPDLVAADSVPVLATPGTLGFGAVRAGSAVARSLGVENVSTTSALAVALQFVPDARAAAAGVTVAASSPEFRIGAGEAVPIQVTLTATTAPASPTAIGGWLVLHLTAAGGPVRELRVPVAATIGGGHRRLLRSVGIGTVKRAGGGSSASLTVDVGSIAVSGRTGDASLDVQPVSELTVELRRPDGRSLGTVYSARDLLPGRAAFSFEARRTGGEPLARGTYRLVVRARSGDGRVEVRRLPFRVR